MAVAVRSQHRTVSERMSAYKCSFQSQPYMGHYSGMHQCLVMKPLGHWGLAHLAISTFGLAYLVAVCLHCTDILLPHIFQ
jgi:hypothetical protein